MKRPIPQSQNESESSISPQCNAQSGEISSPRHPTDVELLHAALECPLVLDHLSKTYRGSLRLQELLSLWQAAGCPDLEQWQIQASGDASLQPLLDRESLVSSRRPSA